MQRFSWRVIGNGVNWYCPRIARALVVADRYARYGIKASVVSIMLYLDEDGRRMRAPFVSVYEGQAQ